MQDFVYLVYSNNCMDYEDEIEYVDAVCDSLSGAREYIFRQLEDEYDICRYDVNIDESHHTYTYRADEYDAASYRIEKFPILSGD